MRKKIAVILAAAIILLALNAFKNWTLKTAIEVVITKATGAPTKIGGFSFGILFRRAIRIKNLIVYSPEGFDKNILLKVPKINVDYVLPAILRKKIYLKELAADIEEIGIIKNKEGRFNVDALKVTRQEEQLKEKKKKPAPDFKIDTFTLTVNRLVKKDFTVDKPLVTVYEVGIKEKVYNNITGAKQLAFFILTEPMKKAGIEGAKFYGAATLLGAGFLPAGVAGVLIGKDSSEADFKFSREKVFNAGLEVMKEAGDIIESDKSLGIIKGKIAGVKVTVKVTGKQGAKTRLIVSARKLAVPKPQIAGGVVYQIKEKLK